MADAGSQDYQAYNVVLGTRLITGFARGDSFSIVYDEDENETLVGNRGLGAWMRRINQAATITMELFRNSQDNFALQSMLIANRRSRRGFGAALVAIDQNGGTSHVAGLVRVVKQPDFAIGDTIGSYVWTLKTTRMTSVLTGILPPETGTIQRALELAATLAPLPVAV